MSRSGPPGGQRRQRLRGITQTMVACRQWSSRDSAQTPSESTWHTACNLRNATPPGQPQQGMGTRAPAHPSRPDPLPHTTCSRVKSTFWFQSMLTVECSLQALHIEQVGYEVDVAVLELVHEGVRCMAGERRKLGGHCAGPPLGCVRAEQQASRRQLAALAAPVAHPAAGGGLGPQPPAPWTHCSGL